jgi:hypothetical protein
LHAFGACNTIITALISKRYLIFSSVSVNSGAYSAFGASTAELAGATPLLKLQLTPVLKLELAAELTDSLENIRYLFEINAVIMV